MVFREEVQTAAWLDEVEHWVDGRLAARGWTRTGPGDQRRVRPWSTQVVLPTDHGPVWFKANNPHLAHEPQVQSVLARLCPDLVDEPVGVDGARGWLLTEDRGATLRDRDGLTDFTLGEVLGIVADLQRRLVAHESDLLAAGLPDCRPHTVPERFDLLVDTLGDLPGDHPSYLSQQEVRRLRAFRDEVAGAAERLEASPLASTFQHGDAHAGNVFQLDDGGLRLFDFGDSQWAHPLETLVVPWALARHEGLAWPAAEAAYLARWADLVDHTTLRALWRDAALTHDVNRAQLWWHALEGARPDELAEWGGMAKDRMSTLLEPFDPDA